jgi:cullin 3
MKRDP